MSQHIITENLDDKASFRYSDNYRFRLMEASIGNAKEIRRLKMRPKKIILEAFKCMFVVLLILWVAFQSSCVSPSQMTVAPERRIPLVKDTPQEGSWESIDVALKYQYVEQTGVIQLSVSGKAKRKYDQLLVWVELVDAEGKILETKSIYNSGFRSGLSRGKPHKGTIEKTIEIPLGTTAIAFKSSLKPRKHRR